VFFKTDPTQAPYLFSFDLGLSFGWALFNQQTQLTAFGSQHFSQRGQLRTVIPQILEALPDESIVCIEGGGELMGVWERSISKYKLTLLQHSAEDWRQFCLLPRERDAGKEVAKKAAIRYAYQCFKASNQPSVPKQLQDDTAEAILYGYWVMTQLGWMSAQKLKALLEGRSFQD
jgi:hypothetical protein